MLKNEEGNSLSVKEAIIQSSKMKDTIGNKMRAFVDHENLMQKTPVYDDKNILSMNCKFVSLT